MSVISGLRQVHFPQRDDLAAGTGACKYIYMRVYDVLRIHLRWMESKINSRGIHALPRVCVKSRASASDLPTLWSRHLVADPLRIRRWGEKKGESGSIGRAYVKRSGSNQEIMRHKLQGNLHTLSESLNDNFATYYLICTNIFRSFFLLFFYRLYCRVLMNWVSQMDKIYASIDLK